MTTIIPNIPDDINLTPNQPMKTGKASGWGGAFTYYWVSLAVTEERNNNSFDYLNDVEAWCAEQFGKSGSRWFIKQGKFYFKNEHDMTVFILRWS